MQRWLPAQLLWVNGRLKQVNKKLKTGVAYRYRTSDIIFGNMKSRQNIPILIGLMSIALIGVIVIQFLWIKSAIQLKQEQFDGAVHHALMSVSGDLGNKYGVHLITEKLDEDSNIRKEILKQDPGFYNFMISVNDDKQKNADEENNSKEPKNLISVSNETNYEFYTRGEDPERSERIEIRSHNGHKIIAVVNLNRGNKQHLKAQKNTIQKPPVAQEPPLAPQSNKLMNIVKDAADEYAMSKMSEKDINELIDSPKIIRALKKAFAARGLPESFVFATYSVSGDSVIINKAYSKSAIKDFAYQSPLLPTDFIETSTLLLVDFPARYRYIFTSIAGLLVLSLFFSITIISAFAYSLRVIFKQKKLSEITTDFINNMTHELKTPLATISMTADTLALVPENQHAQAVPEYAGMIKNEARRLSRHVDRILDAALPDKNTGNEQYEIIDINQLVEEEVKVFQSALQKRNGKIEILLPVEKLKIYANRDMLRGAISNLLDNAVKYSKETPEIKISARRVNSYILFCVEDRGVGIGKADQKLVFEKFYRVHTGNRHDVKGFGLGLNFVKNIIESMNGKVWVESELGKGSKFFMEFPAI